LHVTNDRRLSLSTFDVEAIMACQRRNIETLSQANQLTVEAVQAVARRQIEIARQTLETFGPAARHEAASRLRTASPEHRIRKQMLEKSVTTSRDRAVATKGRHRGG